MNKSYLLLGLLPILLFPTGTFAAGFDCSKASSRVEKLICSDNKLDAADTELSRLYRESKRSLPKTEVTNFKREQRAWLAVRDKHCTTPRACLSVYRNRLDVLKIKASWKQDRSVITPRALYERFNMRTIRSSYGQRLKYHCNTYPFEYFSESQAKIEGKNVLVLDNGEDFWVFKILPGKKVSIVNQIVSGTYRTVVEYDLKYDSVESDWKATEADIVRSSGCVLHNIIANEVQASDWYLGKWKVTDAKFPGISAMGMDEAKVWFGSVASYTKGKVSFRDEVCGTPSYKVKTLSENEYFEAYRATFKELGIEGKTVEILDVGCPSNWIAAGSTIIKANNQFGYTLWDGVFFRIDKLAP